MGWCSCWSRLKLVCMRRVLLLIFNFIFVSQGFAQTSFGAAENAGDAESLEAPVNSCDPASLCAEYTKMILEQARKLDGKPVPEFFWENRGTRQKQEWDYALPFLAQRVIDRGFSLPKPYGLSVIFFHQDQGINLGDLKLAFKDDVPLKDIDFVKFTNAHVENYTWQAKLDAWIFPFLNVFAVVGSIKGSGNVPVSIAAKDVFASEGIDICDGAHTPELCNSKISYDAPINYYGYNVGLGFLLGAGYQNYFFAMPVTYVKTYVNVTDVPTYVFNVTPRLGYNWGGPLGKMGFYLGANYQQMEITLRGRYMLPLTGTEIGHDVPVNYEIKESPMDLWNAITGLNWEISKEWSVVVELGYSQNRENQTFVMNYRW